MFNSPPSSGTISLRIPSGLERHAPGPRFVAQGMGVTICSQNRSGGVTLRGYRPKGTGGAPAGPNGPAPRPPWFDGCHRRST